MHRRLTLVAVGVAVVLLALAVSGFAEDKVHFLDLETKMNRKLTDDLGSGRPGNSLAALPMGEQTLAGAKFKVGPGLVQLGSKSLPDWPNKVEGIAVDRPIAKLHILHSTCYGRGMPGNSWFVADGTLVGQYTVHFEDGSTESILITYGQDLRDWWCDDNDKKELTRGRIAWTGENAAAAQFNAKVQIYATTWTNPKPAVKVARIDYRSNGAETVAAPFCLAISVEEK